MTKEIEQKNLEIQRLERIIESFSKKTRIYHIAHSKNNALRFGVIGDTQIGSLYERVDALNEFYKLLKREKIKVVFHSGDVLDGHRVYRGQEYELYALGFEAQLKACKEKYPKIKGIETYFITGNHDASFKNLAGVDVGKEIERVRPDLHFLDEDIATVLLETKDGKKVKYQLIHPSGGTAYAVSYKSQKQIESYSGGDKPHAVFIGHFHKADYMPQFRNVAGFQVGCFSRKVGIRTDKGITLMNNIRIGDRVLTHKNRLRKVTKLFKRKYSGKWIQLNFGRKNSDASKIIATEEHPILVERDNKKIWIPIKDIQIGEMIFILSSKCKNCGDKIPYYNKFCNKCNPSMIGAKHKPQEKKYNKNTPAWKHFERTILPFCENAKKDGRMIIPINPFVIPDAIEIIDNKIILHEFENSNRPNYEKYEKDFSDKFHNIVQWHVNNGLKGNSQQSWYEYDKETELIKVKIIQKKELKRNIKNVYNFEVEEDNSYIASNVAVHNCFQSQTPFMLRKPTPAHIGGWIIEDIIGDKLIRRLKAEFISFFEPQQIKEIK